MLPSLVPNFNSWRKKDLKQSLTCLVVIIIFTTVICAFGWPQGICKALFCSNNSLPRRGDDHCKAADPAHILGIENCGKISQLTQPAVTNNWIEYKIAIVADLDEEKSKVPGKHSTWRSFYKEGVLRRHFNGKFTVKWSDQKMSLQSQLSEKGRGLELSDLVMFNGKLLTVDDRTGIVYQIVKGKVIPWVILQDGDGSVSKGFKGEWMTVKENTLYVGGLGKEWTTPTGEVVNFNPQYVKSVGPLGNTVHHNWREVYNLVRSSLGIKSPGYVIHEAVMWSGIRKRWYFLPRRASHEKYNDQDDEKRATNFLISCDKSFENMSVVKVGILQPTHGFSSFKFVPGTNEEIIAALRSVEDAGNISTYIMVFNIDGSILMEESLIDYDKYEGLEFI